MVKGKLKRSRRKDTEKRKAEGKVNGNVYKDLRKEENSPRTGFW